MSCEQLKSEATCSFRVLLMKQQTVTLKGAVSLSCPALCRKFVFSNPTHAFQELQLTSDLTYCTFSPPSEFK